MSERFQLNIRDSRQKLKMSWLDKAISYVSPKTGLSRLAARARIEMAANYRGSESSRLRSDWVLGVDSTTPGGWELSRLRERARDLNRNDPLSSGATDTLGHNIVGKGLKPQSRLRAEYLPVDEEKARSLQRQAELIWNTWAPLADSGNRLDFDEIQFVALRKIIEDGETIALPVMVKNEPWRTIRRAVELVESERLARSDVFGMLDTGIELGNRGEPKTYHIRKADHQNKNQGKSVAIPARDKAGRPNILHVFRTLRPGQQRGIPLFAPVLTYFKDLADYLEAEVVAARVAACLAVFITKQDPMNLATAMQTDTETSSGDRIAGIEPGLVGYLNTGESINVVDPKRPGDSFQPFLEGLLRIIGASLGLPYELLLKDFSKTNYSSARAALLEGRRMFTTWRGWFARRFCQPIWDLVLEEAYLRGLFDAPDFYKYRSEYTRALWIGGGWGWVDPTKEVEASSNAVAYGLSTLAEEAAGQGRDWEEILEQRKREQDKAAELGVVLHTSSGQAGEEKGANAETEEE